MVKESSRIAWLKRTFRAKDVADIIDVYCAECSSLARRNIPSAQRAFQQLVKDEINSLKTYFTKRLSRKVIAAYYKACDDCGQKGAQDQTIERRLSCGLRTGILERQKRTYRKK